MDAAEADWIDRFVHHLEYERRLSPATCTNYRRDLGELQLFCDGAGIDRWRDIDSEHELICARGASQQPKLLLTPKQYFEACLRFSERHPRRFPSYRCMPRNPVEALLVAKVAKWSTQEIIEAEYWSQFQDRLYEGYFRRIPASFRRFRNAYRGNGGHYARDALNNFISYCFSLQLVTDRDRQIIHREFNALSVFPVWKNFNDVTEWNRYYHRFKLVEAILSFGFY